MHLLPVSFFLTMDQHDYGENDTLDYEAVLLATELLPAAEVVVMGTSRAREGLQSPDLVSLLGEQLGHRVTVRNYGVASGRIDTSMVLLDRLAHQDKLPRVLVLAVDASDFRDVQIPGDRFRLVSAGSAVDEIRRNGWPDELDFTHVIGNSIPLRLALARTTIHYRLVRRGDFEAGDARRNNAAFGGTSEWARDYARALAIRDRPPRMRVNKAHIARAARSYVVQDDQLAKLGAMMDRARHYGVRVVLAELPVSPPVRSRELVAAARDRLRAELHRLADGSCVQTWTMESMDDDFGMRDFRDASHMCARGARRYAQLLSATITEALNAAEAGDACSTP